MMRMTNRAPATKMKLHPLTKEAYQLFHDGALAFSRAESFGMRVDVELCRRRKKELTQRIKKLEQEILDSDFGKRWARHTRKINLGSNHQLAEFLYGTMKLRPRKKTATGRGATDDEALKELGIPEVLKILEIRRLKKLRDTYLDAYLREQVNGIIHPFFNLHLVRTFRSSSDHPNFQNIPKRNKEAMQLCRSVLFPHPGRQFISADYSGIEVRMACVYTEDPKLIHDTTVGDMHRDMAIELYELDGLDKSCPGEKVLRQGAKNSFVFPQFYGDYYEHCAQGLLSWAEKAELRDGTPALVHLERRGLVRLSKDGKLRDNAAFVDHVRKIEDRFWNARYRVYSRWKDRVWKRYQARGYVDLKTGFRCQGLMNKKDVTNYPLQGTAFHCLLWSFIQMDRRMAERDMQSRMVSQVHDEMIVDAVPDELTAKVAPMMQQVMTSDITGHWTWLKVIPLEVEFEVAEVDKSLADRKDLRL